MPAEYIVILIIIIIFVIGCGLYIYKKQYLTNVAELKDRKKFLLEGVPTQRLDVVREMNINGKSQAYADKLEAMWQDILSGRNIEVENFVFQAEQSAQRYRFKEANNFQQQAHEALEAIESDLMRLSTSLEDLINRQEANEKRIEVIHKEYELIRTELLDDSGSFGHAVERLEEGLASIEREFDRFEEVTDWGDHEEAREVVLNLEDMTEQMKDFMRDVPAMLSRINDDYYPQLAEISESYEYLMREGFVISGKPIPKEVAKIETEIDSLDQAISELDMDEARKLTDFIESEIETIYDRLEREMTASKQVEELLPAIQKAIYYLKEEIRVLFFEIDRISQSYVLIHNEQQLIKQLRASVEEQEARYERIVDNLENSFTPYSEAAAILESVKDRLTELNQDKNDVSDQLYAYRNKEMDLKEELIQMEQAVHNCKRQLIRENLPGVPTEYDEFYHYVSNLVQTLGEELSRPKLKMEKIYDIKAICDEELKNLEEKTEEVIDQANLTEALAQKLYQYRDNHPEVNQVIAQGMKLFNEDYDYESSLRVIRNKLNHIDANVTKTVEDRYYANK